MLGVLFDAYTKRNIIALLQLQPIDGMPVGTGLVQIHALLLYAQGFHDPELR